MTFYDRSGKPIAYCDDGETMYLFSGEPVAYLHKELVYSFPGIFLGRLENGWVRDRNGYCVFFTEDAAGGGPAKPAKWAKPGKGGKWGKPGKSGRMAPYARPARIAWWSDLSGEEFFHQN